MKKLLFLSLMICFLSATKLAAQPWMQAPYLTIEKSEATFGDIQKAFYAYWGNKPYERGKGYKQFKRWEYMNQPHCFPDGKVQSAMRYIEAYNHAVSTSLQYRQTTTTANWIPLGISSWTNGLSGYNPGNGRVNFVAQHPTNPDIIYIASASGGIWKTEDGGNSWNTTYDNMTRLGTSCIAFHPTNPDTVFIGTGDRDAWNTQAFGIIKTTNNGATWQNAGFNMGLNYNNINRILINPKNNNSMLIATPTKIYKSINGGSSWKQVYDGNNNNIHCMEYKPEDTTTVFAGGGMFLQSTDGGLSFTENTSVPNDTCRIEVAVSTANPDYVYILSSKSDDTFGGLYCSTNSGTSFTLMSTTPNIFGYSVDSNAYTDNAGQAWYDMAIAVSPLDENTIFSGGVNIWKSTNGGTDWTPITNWKVDSAFQYTHADIHYLGFYGNRFYCGSDGGVFLSTDYGTTWTDLSDGLEITQFYAFANSQLDNQLLIAGAQDNGSNKLENGIWSHVSGADGFEALIHPTTTSTFYCSSQNGDILRTYDNGDNFDKINTTGQDGAWQTPIAMNPADPAVIYMGLVDLWRSSDEGDNWTALTDSLIGAQYIDELTIAPSDPAYIYFSNADSLYYSYDSGNSWASVCPDSGHYITGIAVSTENPKKLWIAASAWQSDRVMKSENDATIWTNITEALNKTGLNCIIEDPNSPDGLYVGTETGVFYRDTTMAAWQAFDTNLPKVIVNELEIVSNIQRLRAATYGRGVWESPLYTIDGLNDVPDFQCEIYPNPAISYVELKMSDPVEADLIRIFDAGGKMIKEVPVNGSNIVVSVKDFSIGNYYFRVEHKGLILGTKKVMVMH